MWHLKRMQTQGFASSKSLSCFWKPLLKQAKSSSQVIFFQVIDETLSPTWDQLLLFSSVLVYGTRFCFWHTFLWEWGIIFYVLFTCFRKIEMFHREDIKTSPPITVIEIWDQDKVYCTSRMCTLYTLIGFLGWWQWWRPWECLNILLLFGQI